MRLCGGNYDEWKIKSEIRNQGQISYAPAGIRTRVMSLEGSGHTTRPPAHASVSRHTHDVTIL